MAAIMVVIFPMMSSTDSVCNSWSTACGGGLEVDAGGGLCTFFR